MTLEHAGRQEVTLHTELDFLSKYLEIEQTRFAERLIVRFDIDPETLDTLLPSLLLQPLVENAIKHGVSRKAGPGHVDITARRDHDKLWIEIRDDGAGLSESCAVGAAERRRRLDDAGTPAAPVRRRFPFRIPSPGTRRVGRRRGALADRAPQRPELEHATERSADRPQLHGAHGLERSEAGSRQPALDPQPQSWNTDMKKIRTLVVDDEPLARERLTGLLFNEPDIEIVGQCRDGEEAITSIMDLSPDLVFLDVQMPQMNGFDVIEAVGNERMPLVIFVTAYDQHALKAFQVRALDYLLKPFDRERFTEALQRARKQIEREETGDLGRRLLALVKDLRKDQPRAERLVVKAGGRLFFLRTDEIDWIEAAGNYVRLHVGNTSHLLRETMNAIEGRLDPEKFFRIHRSRIVNMERIQELQPWLEW